MSASQNNLAGVFVKTYVFRVELQKEEDGRWSVWIPGFPGLASWGHTQEEALRNIQDAAEAYVEDMQEAGESLPLARENIEVLDRPAVAVTIS